MKNPTRRASILSYVCTKMKRLILTFLFWCQVSDTDTFEAQRVHVALEKKLAFGCERYVKQLHEVFLLLPV